MANSSITITFNSVPAAFTNLVLLYNTTYPLPEVFKTTRTVSRESKIGSGATETAFNYVSAFGLDYNNTSLYTIVRSGNVVTITANNVNSQFTVASNTTSGAVTTSITNVAPPVTFSLDSVVISEATTLPCDNVKLTITSNEQADNLTSPLSQVATTNPIVLDVPRQDRIQVSIKKGTVTKTSYVNVPKLLAAYFSVDRIQTPSSASISVNNSFLYTPAFTLEYSIDNVIWQSSKSFNELPIGSYTVYIRDSIGCSISLDFTIDAFTPNLLDYEGIAEISNLNPIRYKEDVTWSDTILRTPYNTLSFEEDIRGRNNAFLQLFNKSDSIKTQIKTNYSTIAATIIKSDEVEVTGGTNVLLYSNDLSNAVWTKTYGTIVGEKIVTEDFGGAAAQHDVKQIVSKTAEAKTYTFSTYVKASGVNKARIQATHPGTNAYAAVDLNLTTGALTLPQSGNGFTLNSYSATNEGDGWWRLSINFTSNTETSVTFIINLGGGAVAGDGVIGIFAKNNQMQEGDLSTYVETTTTPATAEPSFGTPLTVNKMTDNMNITDVRDAVILGTSYNGLNYVSVKFSGGSTYDPMTLLANGDYNLGGQVPDWMNAGDYLNIQGAGWFKVLETAYNNDYVLVLNALVGDFPLALGTYVVTTVYNSVDFERYEFTCDFSALEGYYKVQIDLTDTEFESKSFVSEWLNIQDAHLNTHLIEYYNSENNEINFNTGFVGRIRVPYVEGLKWKPNTEQDIYVTDTNTVSLESKYRGFWDFSARPMPVMMAEKLTMILLQDRLFINTVNYIKEGDIESKAVGGQYLIKAGLVKSNYVYNTNSGLGVGEQVLEGTPLAITPSGGFLLVE